MVGGVGTSLSDPGVDRSESGVQELLRGVRLVSQVREPARQVVCPLLIELVLDRAVLLCWRVPETAQAGCDQGSLVESADRNAEDGDGEP